MSRLRALAGPACLGIAVWCACGVVGVATADAATPRLVIPAPWWCFLPGVVAGLALPRVRENWRFGLPALLTTIPWWPIPLPSIALLWTGPLAWAPVGLSVFAALGADEARSTSTASPRGRAILAAALTALVAGTAAWAVSPRLPGGDEPHYLAIAQSLLRDGDLRIENNHHDPDFVAAFGDLKPDYIVRGRDGAIYSIHAPGVAVLVLPAFRLAGYRGAQAMVIGAAAWTGGLIWIAAWRATRDPRAAWFAWAAITGSTTFLLQSGMVFPDGPGALAVAAAVWLIVRVEDPGEPVGPSALIAVSTALAALPWLHSRFSVLAAGLGALVAWRLLVEPGRLMPERLRRLSVFAIVPVMSAAAWFAYFVVIYGTPNPAAPYGNTSGPDGTHVSYAPGGLVGLLLDEQFGLVMYAPVLAAAVVGFVRGRGRPADRLVALAAGAAGLYLAVAATYWMWWAGVPATPARLVTAVLPVLAVPLARAWVDATPGARGTLVTLLGATLAISAVVIGIDRGLLAWNVRDAEARWLEWLGPLVNLPRGWPSFFWSLSPGHPWSEAPFVIHAAMWVSVFAAGWVFETRLSAARAWKASVARLAAVWWLLACLTVAIGAGWWLTSGRPLDPTRAQLAVLTKMAAGERVIRLDAFSVARVMTVAGAMKIATEEIGPEGSQAWATFAAVPPGAYRVRVQLSRPQAGAAIVTIERDARTEQVFLLQPLSEQSFSVTLPQGAARMTIAPDQALRNVQGVVELEPLTIGR
ncbi:MAG: hypothetical protein ACHQO8_01775 [Vicinamibacterales bacterium]